MKFSVLLLSLLRKTTTMKGHTNDNRHCAYALAWVVHVLCVWYVVVPSELEWPTHAFILQKHLQHMKRFLLLLCIFGSFFTSCQDDTKDTHSLTGTTWETTKSGTLITLAFNSSTATLTRKEYSWMDESMKERYSVYLYDYNHPNLTLHPVEDDTIMPDLLGVINGSTMTISNPTITSGSQVIYTLYKK